MVKLGGWRTVLLGVLMVWGLGLEGEVYGKGKPNFVVVFCDDLGYGDLGCFGNPTIATPHLDLMAREGQKWTSFYSAACVCTPSRAGLLTGRLPVRSGMASSRRRVLFPNSKGGLPAREVTVAELLKKEGYATHCVGKWHLGHLKQYLPGKHGFDTYFGIPYSNDMDRLRNVGPRGRAAFWTPKSKYWNVPLIRGEKEIERPADQTTITKRYTEEAVKIIKGSKGKPFFIYLAHSMPHVPLFTAKEFVGKSKRGLYGDVIEEIDWSVGQVVKALKEEGLDENTLVVFTSDNGPWLIFNEQGGSAGLLREGKGSTWDGGVREPTVFWWPGKLKKGVVSGMGSTLDLLPTMVSLAGGKVPTDRKIDGYDLSGVLLKGEKSPRNEMFFYRGVELFAVRHGVFKAHFKTRSGYKRNLEAHDPPLLYHMEHDPSEKFDVGKKHGDVIERIKQLAKAHTAGIKPVENQLEK